ncbi:glycosyltransferase family 2 protein [Pseudomonas rubra]|uniref:Glycosyltransferase family 2 protein n=1 Tax=Pseudomonas rubra TaxID=2942627 RepID=A0ABT5P1E2_9PSED|nr:glycosyltransferase family 2 protein [Pseudomonas rubra]MDD1012090.1 glycosyltransferase family 2 protein [Pseudomonas rubra]MDD1038474.1 glycosyltransferase family 2 protein [Pseudomonas rubra]MDD1153511.1 glycosyltransferase family 2 protein [Pseudomonas rubra]
MLTLPQPPSGAEPRLSIIVPCYQEEQVLQAFHQRIGELIERLPVPCELLYINDGSSDDTPALLRQFQQQPGVRCLHLSRNFGKEAALRAGLDHASGQAVVFIDADLQDPPELIGLMVEHWLQGYDVVNMQRSRRDGDSWLKKFTARLYYRIMRHLVGRGQLPAQVSDFRLIGPAPLAALRAMDERVGLFKGLVGWVGFRTIELPYERVARAAGTSKWDYPALLNLALEGALAFSRKPLRWYSVASLVIVLVCLGWMLAALIAGSFSPVHLLLGVGGFLCLGVAMLGEYLGATLFEVKRRPHYLLQGDSRVPGEPVVRRPFARRRQA